MLRKMHVTLESWERATRGNTYNLMSYLRKMEEEKGSGKEYKYYAITNEKCTSIPLIGCNITRKLYMGKQQF